MLSFSGIPNEYSIFPIRSKGKIADVVVFARPDVYKDETDFIKYPLAQYKEVTIFFIADVIKENNVCTYVLKDSKGKIVYASGDNDTSVLYDAQEWLKCIIDNSKKKEEEFEKRIHQLEDHEKLLKDILIAQGKR